MEQTKRISLKRYITRISYFIGIMLILILVFILKTSALFFEKQASNHASHLVDTFLRSHQEVLREDPHLLEREVDNILAHPSVMSAKIFNNHGGLIFSRRKDTGGNGAFPFGLSPIVVEKELAVNGAHWGTLRVTLSAQRESRLLRTLTLTLIGIFLVFAGVFYLFIRRYNTGVSKELLLLKDSIEEKVEVEALETREFSIEELALIQRKIKSDSKDMRALKEELEKRENLALIGNFASSIVHDIRNPLSVIDGYASILKPEVPAKEQKYIQKISNASAAIQRLLEDILTFVRERKVELKMRKWKPSQVIRAALQLLESVMTEKGVSVETESAGDQSIRCDIDRLSRAIANLVKNSVDVSPPGSVVTVKAYQENGAVIFSVEDNGPGIPETIRNTVFEPFATANKRNGTGLGLFIVKSIVTAHNGDITFETGESGTRFFIKMGG